MKKLFLTLVFVCATLLMAAQITDPSTIQEGTAHAKWTGGTTDRFDVQMRIGDIFYDSDSAKYYYLECNFYAHQRPSDVYANASCYQEVSSGFFPPTAAEIGEAVYDSLNAAIDSLEYLLEQNNLYQDSILQKMGTSVAAPVNYVVPNQGATVTYTSSTSLTLSGLPVVISSNCQVVYAQAILADSSRFYINGIGGITLSYSGGVVTVTGATDAVPFPTTASFSVGLNVPQWALDYTLNAQRMYQINSMELKMTSMEEVIAFTDDGAGTSDVIIDVGATSHTNMYGYYWVYAGTVDTVDNYCYVTWDEDATTGDLSKWLNVSSLVMDSAYLRTITNEYDSIPFTLNDIYDNGYGVPYRVLLRTVITGGTDNQQITKMLRVNEK